MKATTLQKRLDARYKGGKTSFAYKAAKQVIEGKKQIRPAYTSGSGRYVTLHDHTFACQCLFNILGIKFETGNDAPRGGKTGNFINILTKIS